MMFPFQFIDLSDSTLVAIHQVVPPQITSDEDKPVPKGVRLGL